jgi:hypothetical protein
MAILLIVAAVILIGIVLLILKLRGGTGSPPVGRDRFKHVGPGEAKPKEPRATGLD